MRLFMIAEFLSLMMVFAPAEPPKKGGLVFPEVVPTDTSPAPKPVPGAVAKLTGDMLYVVPSESPFLLFASPVDKVTITREAGPIKIRGRFLDGNGKTETRTYSAKHVAIIEASGTGRVELIAVPGGAVDEKEAVRLAIDVDVQGSQPPPKPDPIPEPKPKPPPIDPKPEPNADLVDGPVWLVTVTGPERSITASKLVNDTAYWKSLESSGHKFRHYSPTDASAIESGYTKVHSALGDCLIIVKPDAGGKTGTVVRKLALPPLTTDVNAILKATVKP